MKGWLLGEQVSLIIPWWQLLKHEQHKYNKTHGKTIFLKFENRLSVLDPRLLDIRFIR